MTKIDFQALKRYSRGQLAITIPKVYLKDNKLSKGKTVEIFRTEIDDKDVLIIFPKNRKKHLKEKINEFRER